MTDQPVLRFADQAAFEAWMDKHHASSDGVWIEYAKKGAGERSIVYDEALEVALCFGWIDGQVRTVDERWYRQRWTPRRPRSSWSKRNVGKVAELIAAGRMRPAGHAEVERAQADGRWDAAYKGQRTAAVPEDLQHRLDHDPAAAAAFAALDARNRYSIIWRVNDAKRLETRERRIEGFLEMLRRGDRPHP